MADTVFTTTADFTAYDNPNAFFEPKVRAEKFLAWESNSAFTRGEILVDNTDGITPIQPGTVLVDENDDYVGTLLGRPQSPGTSAVRTVVERGEAIFWGYALTFPERPAVIGDAGAAPPVLPQTAVQATAALKAKLVAQMAERSIQIHD